MGDGRDEARGDGKSGLEGVEWLSADQQRQWRSLMAVIMTLPAALDAQLKRDAGMNGFEYQVLAALSEAPSRTLVLSDLAAMARGSLSRLSHALTRLERAGWVVRRSCTDRAGRRMQATLTDAGMDEIERVAPGHVREVRRLVVDALTPAQLAALGEAARAITDAVAAGPAVDCAAADDC